MSNRSNIVNNTPKYLLKVFWTSLTIRLLTILFSIRISYNSTLDVPKWSTELTCSYKGYNKCSIIRSRPILYGPVSFPYTNLISFLDENDINFNRNFNTFKKLLSFLSYDSERFLKYSTDNLVYGTEDSMAFFPLLPYLLLLLSKLLRILHVYLLNLGIITVDILPLVIYTAISGLVLINTSAIISSCLLYLLCWDFLYKRSSLLSMGDGYFEVGIRWPNVFDDIKLNKIEFISYLSSILYILSPNSIHSTSLYTESLFSLLSFSAFLLLNKAENLHHKLLFCGDFISKITLYFYEFSSFILLLLCCTLRSNGILLLLPLFFYTLRTCPILSKFNLLLPYYLNNPLYRTYDASIPSNTLREPFSIEGNTTSFPLAVVASPPEVSPAVSFSNYLSLKSRATPRDRGDEGNDWTSSGPEADLREAKGEVNKEATTASGKELDWTSGGEAVCKTREPPAVEIHGSVTILEHQPDHYDNKLFFNTCFGKFDRKLNLTSILFISFLFHWLKALVQALLLQMPMIIFQLYGYVIYCLDLSFDDLRKVVGFTSFIGFLFKDGSLKRILNWKLRNNCRSWCFNTFPSIYKFVQHEYWNLCFLWVFRDPIRLAEAIYSSGTYLVSFFCFRRYYSLLKNIYNNLKNRG